MTDYKPFLIDPAHDLEAAAADLHHVLTLATTTPAERSIVLALMPSLRPLMEILMPDTPLPPFPHPPTELALMRMIEHNQALDAADEAAGINDSSGLAKAARRAEAERQAS